ncbi:MAG TPA: respiratory nitrate reductase subunit gamma [Thermoanaerobaculia bacterium]|nr:respiratory nitrate reductase subunit gamma [Thermoanaerobaculia bacterium]
MSPLLFVALPYAAVVVCVAGTIWRFRARLTISAQSSQILENRWLIWGTVPFHAGIALLLLGHLIPLLLPNAWRALVSNRAALLTVETAGAGAAILCLIGLLVLFLRRLAMASVRASSTVVDLIVLAILIAQVALGLAVATMHRWGAVWSVGTVVPYLRSLAIFQPDPTFIAGVPTLVMFHLTGAWIVVALLPFTRLVHMFTLPLGYLGRPPQKVVWVTRG